MLKKKLVTKIQSNLILRNVEYLDLYVGRLNELDVEDFGVIDGRLS